MLQGGGKDMVTGAALCVQGCLPAGSAGGPSPGRGARTACTALHPNPDGVGTSGTPSARGRPCSQPALALAYPSALAAPPGRAGAGVGCPSYRWLGRLGRQPWTHGGASTLRVEDLRSFVLPKTTNVTGAGVECDSPRPGLSLASDAHIRGFISL